MTAKFMELSSKVDHRLKPESLNHFLRELTDLSIKYKIGITGNTELFVVEPDDLNLNYSCDSDSRLTTI